MKPFLKKYLPEHTQLYFGLMVLMAISLPLSKALMSIVPGFLMANWLFEGNFALKFERFKQRKSLWLLLSLFLIYPLGLLWTNSLEWGIHDVKIQLPMLVLPLVIGTSGALSYRQIKWVIYAFSAAIVVSTLCSMWVWLGFSGKAIHDPRQISLFIWHIRFALLINIAIFSLGWFLLNSEKKPLGEKVSLAVTMLWLTIFLVILKSATGWVVFLLVLIAVTIRGLFYLRNILLRISLFVVLASLFLVPLSYIGHVVHQFYKVEKIPATILQEKTKLGNAYEYDLKNRQIENGHYIFLYINWDELRSAWSKRSKLNIDSVYASGFNKNVLVRYLTSKGLRKDAEGVEQLSDADVKHIENGMTNYRFENPYSFYNRIYQIIWELDVYRKGGDPAGHSITQRLEYYKIALQIIDDNVWFGHGTGGYYEAYQQKYNQSKYFRNQKYRQRSHNMFLSYWIDFGLVGLLYICYALVAPVFLEKQQHNFLLLVFLFVVVLSFLNEDTLNNHDAISFFAFFYPLYLYNPKAPLNLPVGETLG